MGGIPVTNPHPKIILFLRCCPSLDLQHYKCLPNSGGFNDQNYDDMLYFDIIENRIREIKNRSSHK